MTIIHVNENPGAVEMDVRSRRFLEAVLSAYRPEHHIDTWLSRLTTLVAASCPEQFGAVGRVLDVRPGIGLDACTISIEDPALQSALQSLVVRELHLPQLSLDHRGGPGSMREVLSCKAVRCATLDSRLKHMGEMGVDDLVHVVSTDGIGTWIMVGVVTRPDCTAVPSGRSWSLASRHLGKALRLHKRFFSTPAAPGADATPQQIWRRTLHQLGGAERSSALTRERALGAWQGVLDGSWSSVDRHDWDDRRYLVVVANPDGARDSRGLSPRETHVAALAAEGHSDKWIAYTLGLSRSTVATHLASALEKLSVPSRAMLAQAFQSDGSM